MLKRTILYIVCMAIISAMCSAAYIYADTQLNMDRANTVLRNVNGNDNDFAEYQAKQKTYTNVQDWTPFIGVAFAVAVTIIFWKEPIQKLNAKMQEVEEKEENENENNQ